MFNPLSLIPPGEPSLFVTCAKCHYAITCENYTTTCENNTTHRLNRWFESSQLQFGKVPSLLARRLLQWTLKKVVRSDVDLQGDLAGISTYSRQPLELVTSQAVVQSFHL